MRAADFFGFLSVAGVLAYGLVLLRIAGRFKEAPIAAIELASGWRVVRAIKAARRGERTLITINPEDIRAFSIARWTIAVGIVGILTCALI